MDLVEVLRKYSYDISCKVILGYDPCTLSVDLIDIPPEKVFVDAEKAIFYRHIVPESWWKLQTWLGIGLKKKLENAWEKLDRLVGHCISLKRKELSKRTTPFAQKEDRESIDEEKDYDLLTSFMGTYKRINSPVSGNPDKFLRDTRVSLLFASSDPTNSTLSWFFLLLATNPSVEIKIREEIRRNLDYKEGKKRGLFDIYNNLGGLSKLVYLHAALCEALRIFPAAPLEHKSPVEPEFLPSGHFVCKNMKIILSFYAVGRMEKVWGEDCLEFKPERWISEQGKIKHVPSFKFVEFNAGPRSCIGKEMSFVQMKIVAASIIYHYHMEMVEGHPPITPSKSIALFDADVEIKDCISSMFMSLIVVQCDADEPSFRVQ